jgi:hypothetical protein
MLTLFEKPGFALKIGAQGAAWVEARRGWTGRVHPHYSMVDFPAGAMKLSPMEANVVDLPLVESRLKELITPAPSDALCRRMGLPPIPRPITLVLPDLCARTALLTVEAFPDKRQEQEALVRWRLEQDRLFPMAGTRVAYHAFGAKSKGAKGPQILLAVVMRDVVWSQYDQLCERLGLSIVDLDISSFRLWNLWQRGTGRADTTAREHGLAWMSLLDGGMTIVIVKGGMPIFLRNKPIPSSKPGEPATRLRSDYVIHELTSSLLYCQEQHPKLAPKRLMLVGHDLPPGIGKDIQKACQLDVGHVGWDDAESLGWSQAFDHSPTELLEAVAGLAGAA